jgi:hypothetical protein
MDILNQGQSPLQSLRNRQALIRDRIRAVVYGHANGVYFFGRPGISKTYSVLTFLETLGERFEHVTGHVTPIGLFEALEQNPDSVIVLDDVSDLFSKPPSLQFLLAALGSPPDGSRTRIVKYKRANDERVVHFSGGIIAMSNLQLEGHRNQVLAALQDRVHLMSYEPTDEEIEAEIYHIASTAPRNVAAVDATLVAQFLLEVCRESSARPSIRLYMDKALHTFQQWQEGRSECDWRDLVRSGVQEMVTLQRYPLRDISRKEQIAGERRMVEELCEMFPDRHERVAAWKARTGKSQAAFYRRFKELKHEGRLPDDPGCSQREAA